MVRLSSEIVMMEMAFALAGRSTCDRLQVGALIARDFRVISTGYNGNVAGSLHCHHASDPTPCTTAVHAEANALVFAARHGVAVHKADLFTTHMPCLSCAKLIVNSGLGRVFYENSYRLTEGVELLIDSGLLVFRIREDNSIVQMTQSML